MESTGFFVLMSMLVFNKLTSVSAGFVASVCQFLMHSTSVLCRTSLWCINSQCSVVCTIFLIEVLLRICFRILHVICGCAVPVKPGHFFFSTL